jgi:hypothetical protein
MGGMISLLAVMKTGEQTAGFSLRPPNMPELRTGFEIIA